MHGGMDLTINYDSGVVAQFGDDIPEGNLNFAGIDSLVGLSDLSNIEIWTVFIQVRLELLLIFVPGERQPVRALNFTFQLHGLVFEHIQPWRQQLQRCCRWV